MQAKSVYSVADLELVGFTGCLGAHPSPQILAPVFRRRGSPEEIIVPPVRTAEDKVESEGAPISAQEFEAFLHDKEASLLDEPIDAGYDHVVWVNEKGLVEYGPRADALERLRRVAEDLLEAAWSQIEAGELQAALPLIGKALAADSQNLQILIAKGVMETHLRDDAALRITTLAGRSLFPGVDVKKRIRLLAATVESSGVDLPAPLDAPMERTRVPRSLIDESLVAVGGGQQLADIDLFRSHLHTVLQELAGETSRAERVRRPIREIVADLDNGFLDEGFFKLGRHLAQMHVDGLVDRPVVDGILLSVRNEVEQVAKDRSTPGLRQSFGSAVRGLAHGYYQSAWTSNNSAPVRDLYDANDKLARSAHDLKESIVKWSDLGWPIHFGWNEWFEAQVLCEVGARIMQQVGAYLRPLPEPLAWGVNVTRTGEKADLTFLNESMIREDMIFDEAPIYRFRGYHVFARRDFLEAQLTNGLPELVQDELRSLLSVDGNGTPEEDATTARATLVNMAGLGYLTGTDFQVVGNAIVDGGLSDVSRQLSYPVDSLDQQFQCFVGGDVAVFLGGANHATLLSHWWARGTAPPVIEVLSPSQVGLLLERHSVERWRLPLRDFIVFHERLLGRRTGRLRRGLAAFFRELWQALEAVELGDRADCPTDVGRWLLRIAYEKSRGSGWGFATDPEQLTSHIRRDCGSDLS